MDRTELLARAWIECDSNQGGEQGSGFHPDDIIGQSCGVSTASEKSTCVDTPLTGKPYWHWFIPRAKALEAYLAERGFAITLA